MQLIENFKKLTGVVQVAVAFLAVLPGLAVLVGLVELPGLIGGLATFLFGFLGIALLAIIAVLSDAIRGAGQRSIAVFVGLALLGGSASATAYALFADSHVVSYHDNGSARIALIPLNPDAKLQDAADSYGGDYAELLEYSNVRAKWQKRMAQNDAGTQLILIALLMASQLLLVGGTTVALWRASLD